MFAKNCHFIDWLEKADDTAMNKNVTKRLDRATLFYLMAFNLGFQPTEEPVEKLHSMCVVCAACHEFMDWCPGCLRRVKDAMLKAVAKEYQRRGRPMESTGWTPEQVVAYMEHRMPTLKSGADVGVFAHFLPKRSADGTPAALPDGIDTGKEKDDSVARPKFAIPPILN